MSGGSSNEELQINQKDTDMAAQWKRLRWDHE